MQRRAVRIHEWRSHRRNRRRPTTTTSRDSGDHVANRIPRSPTDPVETQAELTARFIRDAIPMRDQLYGRAAHLTGNRADAEDLLQETYLKAYAGFGSFRRGTNVEG